MINSQEIKTQAKRFYTSNKDESVRLFKSDLLESLTKVHPATPLVIFVPIIIFLISNALTQAHLALSLCFILFLSGLGFWTFFEYALHRFVFHFVPVGPITEKLYFLFHGIHHDYPRDSRRLVMPPTVSIGLALTLYWIAGKTLPPTYISASFAGFLLGYLFYDMIHFGIHHFHFTNRFWVTVRNHHMRHHYQDPKNGFGVSSALWDFILRTTPALSKHQEENQPEPYPDFS